MNTPLAATHLAAGAKMGVWFGCALPDYFGDPAAEYRSGRETVALIDKNYRAYLFFTGPDRVRYLNAILTNNIKDLPENHGVISLLLNPQGHILAEIETYAFADRLLSQSYAMIRQQLIEWLDKYIIMDDVTLTDETPRYGTAAGQQATPRSAGCDWQWERRGSVTTSARNKSPTKPACRTATSATRKAATPARKSWSACAPAARSTASACA